MLAALESLRSDRLNALVTLIQKNWRRRMAVKNYKKMRTAAITIQTWWRGVLARRFVESVRREVYAIRLQTAFRRFVQRRKFLVIRQAIVLLQSRTYRSPFGCATMSLILVYRRTGSKGPPPIPRCTHIPCCIDFAAINPWMVRLKRFRCLTRLLLKFV